MVMFDGDEALTGTFPASSALTLSPSPSPLVPSASAYSERIGDGDV